MPLIQVGENFQLDALSQSLRNALLSNPLNDCLDDWSKEASRWLKKYENQKEFGVVVKEAISDLLKIAPEKRASENPFQFGVQLVDKVASKVQHKSESMKKDFVGLFDEVHGEFERARSQLNQLPSGAQAVQEIANQVGGVFSNFKKEILEAHWDLGRDCRPLGSIKFFESISVLTSKFHTAEVEGALTALVKRVVDVTQPAEQLSAGIDQLFKIVDQSNNSAAGRGLRIENALGLIDGGSVNIIPLESLIAQEKITMQGQLGEIQGAFKIVGMLAGDNKLAGDIVAVGEAAISIVGSLATLYAGSAMTGPAMPVVAIAGTVLTLASRFFGSKGPSKEEIISKQIQTLSKHMHERFDRVEFMIERGVDFLVRRMDQGFNALAKNMNRGFKQVRKDIYFVADEILKRFDALGEKLGAIEGQISKVHEAQETILKGINGFKEAMSKHHAEVMDKIYKILASEYIGFRGKVANESKICTVGDLDNFFDYVGCEGGRTLKFEEFTETNKELHLISSEKDFFYSINVLTKEASEQRLAGEKGQVAGDGRLVNPLLWADGVRLLIQFSLNNPGRFNEFVNDRKGGFSRIVFSLRQGGEEIEKYISQLQSSHSLFTSLIQNYRDQLKKVLIFVYHKLLNDIKKYDVDEVKNITAQQALSFVSVKNQFIVFCQILGSIDPKLSLETIHKKIKEKSNISINGTKKHKKLRELNSVANNLEEYLSEIADPNSNVLSVVYSAIQNELQNIVKKEEEKEEKKEKEKEEKKEKEKNTVFLELLNEFFKNNSEFDIKFFYEDLKKDDVFKEKLEDLDKALNTLLIFTAFVFPKQFLHDAQLRAFLDTLLSKQSILDCLALPLSAQGDQAGPSSQVQGSEREGGVEVKNEFVAITIQKMLSTHGELDQLKYYLLSHVAAATAMSKEGEIPAPAYRHPLVEQVFEELDAFEEIMPLQLAAANNMASSNSQDRSQNERPKTPEADFDKLLKEFASLKISVEDVKKCETKDNDQFEKAYHQARLQKESVKDKLDIVSNFFEKIGQQSNKWNKFNEIKTAIGPGGDYSLTKLGNNQ